MSTPILILAGGSSSRMGARDKLTEEVDGQPLLRLQAERALRVSPEVTVLLRPGNDAARACLDGLNVTILQPEDALEGMGGSLRAGTRALREHPGFLLLLADLVDIESNDLQSILDQRPSHPKARIIRGTTQDGAPGHPIYFDRATFPALLALTGDDGGRAVAKAFQEQTHFVPLSGSRARRDLDTVEDWDAWRAHKQPPKP